ncbi:RAD9, HUS1, RAD1-interacting nuclear orphan protein 1 [Ambystoma mexicanum]|uniref:RAD9, HUS1, RAD1-interacting nuclear orphan protein 1 n=1 Tax=Ambystoma mexicanum TaxID=8296 RepID=UPI0037E70C17
MPRKKATINLRKPQLPFLENPLQGPVHQYGSPLQKAENPRYVAAKPLDQSTSTSWVSPQFDHTVDLNFPGRRRRHLSNSTLQARTRKTNQSSMLNGSKACRKPSVCKFPALDFKDFSAIQSCPSDSLWDLRPVMRAIDEESCNTRSRNASEPATWNSPRNHLVQASPLPSLREEDDDDDEDPTAVDDDDGTLSPPDLDTPDFTPLPRRNSIQIRRVLLTPRQVSEECSPSHLSRGAMGLCQDSDGLESSSSNPEGLAPFPVLVADTPEQEYGIRITWRRRRELMKYLKERGKLHNNEILVKRGLSTLHL